MNKLLAALLALALLALVGAGAFFLFGSASSDAPAEPDAAPRPAAPAETAAAPLRAPQDEQRPEPGAAAAVREQAATHEERERSARWESGNLVAVEGEVAAPPGIPRDERLEVLAFAQEPRRERDPDVLAALAAGEGDDDARERERLGYLARADVAPDLRFRLELPRDLEQAWLVLRGRYLFERAPRTVRPAEGALAVRFEPRLGAWVTGRLVPPRGVAAARESLGDTKVELELGMTSEIERGIRTGQGAGGIANREARLADDLGFAYGGVEPGLEFRVDVLPELLAAARSRSFEPQPGEHVALEVQLARGGTIAGRAVDEQGAPVRRAAVEARQGAQFFGAGGQLARKASAGEDGRFRLEAVAPGELLLQAEAHGHIGKQLDVQLAEGQVLEGVELVLERGGAIAGLVRYPDGTPAAEADVDVEFDRAHLAGMGAFNAMRGGEGDAETEEDGSFEVTGLGKGPFTVEVRAAPQGEKESLKSDRQRAWTARLDGVAPGTRGLELVLGPPLLLAGRVVDHAGAPLGEFQVVLRKPTNVPMGGIAAERTTRGFEEAEDGRFEIGGLDAGTWEVVAGAKGHGDSAMVDVVLPQAPDAPPLELRLAPLSVVRGTVLSPEGRPVAGAQVSQEHTLQSMARLRADPRGPRATSAGDGAFELSGVEPGAPTLVATAEGYAASAPTSVEVGPGQTVEGAVLRLRVGGRILGTVFGADRDPLVGAAILAQIPTSPMNQRWGTSDARGEFVLEHVEPGSWQVMTFPSRGGGDGASAEESMSKLLTDLKLTFCKVSDGEDTHVTLGLPPAEAVRVHGRVLLDGAPQRGVLLNFLPDQGGDAPAMEGLRFTSTGAEGRYEVELGGPGAYLISVQRPGATPGTQQALELHEVIPEGTEHVLDLKLPLGAISGRVRGPDGAPARGARISLSVDGPVPNGSFTGGQYAEVEADAEGRYELVWLRPGTYTVAAGGSMMGGLFGDSGTSHGRVVRSGVELREGQRLTGVDFELPVPGAIEGEVRSAGGGPVAGAALFVRDEEGRLLERISMTESDASGRFRYAGVAPGRYSVSARTGELVAHQPASVRVRSGEACEAKLTLEGGTVLVVTLADAEGEPIDCALSVVDAAGQQVNGAWGMSELMQAITQGNFSAKERRVGPLPPGKYVVTATAADGRSATRPVSLSGQDERKVNLRLKE